MGRTGRGQDSDERQRSKLMGKTVGKPLAKTRQWRGQHSSPAVPIHSDQDSPRAQVDVLADLQALQALEEVASRHGVICKHGGLGAQAACEEGEEVQPCHLHPLPPLLTVLLQAKVC